MMLHLFRWLDQFLRRDELTENTRRVVPLLICQAVAGFLYGIVMGSFGDWDNNRLLYSLYAGIKVPLLFWVAFSLCVPVFFVLHALAGLHADFATSMRAILSAQTVLTLVLLAFAPLTALWYLSVDHYQSAILFNGLMFALASFVAQYYLREQYRPLVQREPRHRTLLFAWLGLYLFVAIQFAWVLRPFIGAPNTAAEFFRSESWGNAYVALFRLLRW